VLANEKIWGDPVSSGFRVNAGQEWAFELPMTGRGALTKVMVVQLTGALEGFSYTIYNKRAACPPGQNPTAAAASAGVVEQLYRVFGPVTVPSGKSYFDTGTAIWPNIGALGVFIPYHNLDKDQSTNVTDALYIKIAAGGTDSADKVFGVALTTWLQ
jgi:hypothetical protein